MNKLVLINIILFWFSPLYGQVTTQANTKNSSGFYLWNNSANWVGGTQPNPLSSGINDEIIVDGYITRDGSLSFANIGNNSDEIIINDTLIVNGDVDFNTNAISLTLASESLMVVFGNFSASNKISISNGGILVIVGNMTLTGGNQDYTDSNGGKPQLIVMGTISGNGDTADAAADNGDFDDQDQELQDFVYGDGESVLPVVLNYFEVRQKYSVVEIEWQTLTEENFDHFSIQRSKDLVTFQEIGTIQGGGNSQTPLDYNFVDEHPLVGISYYRLQSIDFDGYTEIFDAVAINIEIDYNFRIYPSVVTGNSINIDYQPIFKENLIFRVIDASGISKYETVYSGGSVDIPFGLRNGIYFVELIDGDIVNRSRIIIKG